MKDDFIDKLNMIIAECNGDSAFSMDKNRPYNGQSHTGAGSRGSQEVKGLTMRDITDCIVRGFLSAGGVYKDNPVWDDVYSIKTDLDFIAVCQNACCEIEKMMGIYPNVPKLTSEDN